MSSIFLRIASTLLALGVALGAFGAHGLASRVSEKDLSTWETAVFYHLVHALALLALSVSSKVEDWVSPDALRVVLVLLFVGILVFSGSLYALVLTNIRWLGAVTPLGGLTFIFAWVYLAYCARSQRNSVV